MNTFVRFAWYACVLACANIASAQLNLNARIVNGQPSDPGQFPYQALLFWDRTHDWTYCGGSLISDQWILSAAHCFNDVQSPIEVHLGALKTLDRNEEGRVIQNTTTIIIHPDYDARVLRNDIALLRLDKPVTFSDTIQPVLLPKSTGNRFQGIDAIASGFGFQNTTTSSTTPILQWTTLHTISNFRCLFYYWFEWVGRESVLCTRGGVKQSICYGDSGGPLVTEDGFQIGVSSFLPEEGCHLQKPSVFTRVTSYMPWIREVTGLEL